MKFDITPGEDGVYDGRSVAKKLMAIAYGALAADADDDPDTAKDQSWLYQQTVPLPAAA